jgi:2'-5' RNA ligase
MRLFTAITFNEEIKSSLCGTINVLKSISAKGTFTERDNLHLTLNFIGETSRLEEVQAAMKHAVKINHTNSFTVNLDGFGRFKRREGDIYWVGVQEEKSLWSLQKELVKRLMEEDFTLEERDFKPHLTLGRRVITSDKFDLAFMETSIPTMSMEVNKISLMNSERIHGKLVYTEIFHIALPSTMGL